MSRWVRCDAPGCTNEAGPLTEDEELLIGWVRVNIEICVGHAAHEDEVEAVKAAGSPFVMMIGSRPSVDQHRRYDAMLCSAECLVRWAQERQVEIATSRLPDAVE